MKHILSILVILVSIVSCKTPEARKPVSVKTGSFIDESVERNKRLNAKERLQIEALISQDSSNTYIASANGFWYYYNSEKKSEGHTPKFGDIVNFEHNMKDLNGKIIYTKEELKIRNYAVDQEELFSGLREGIKLMHEGETVTFIFPSQKAYGYYGDENRIGLNVPLICQVTVNTITKKETN